MMNVVLLALVFATALSVRMEHNVFGDMIGALIQLEIIADSPSTMADWNEMVRLNVSEPPECPFSNHFFSCDIDGALVDLNLTAPPLASPLLARQLNLGQFINENNTKIAPRIRLFNFIGNVFFASRSTVLHFEIHDSIIVNATRPFCHLAFNDCIFFLVFHMDRSSQPTTLILSNVTIHDSDRSRGDEIDLSLDGAFYVCRFQNVSMSCPIPSWLAKCFNVSDASMAPCVAPVVNASSAFVPVAVPCERAVCRVQCTPSPLDKFDCVDTDSKLSKGYFPATPGVSTIELSMRYVGIAHSLTIKVAMYGLVTRVELYDWRTFNWTVVEFSDTRAPAGLQPANDVLALPPVLTNRIRMTADQWYVENDVLYGYSVKRSMFGRRDNPPPPPIARCAVAESLNSRSILDESIGDSYCIGRVCQLACQFADNFTFDRAVVPQFVIIDGGSLWTGAELVDTPSDQTRVYRYNVSTRAIASVNISADLGAVARVRLVGDPASGNPLPSPTLPPRGFPGVLVKRWFRSLPPGFAKAALLSIATCPQLPANAVSSAHFSNSSFVFTSDGTLLQCLATSWEPVDAKLTLPVLNRNASIVARKLVAIDDRLLVVVVASNVLHDGTANRLLVNRRAISTAIDVLDVRTGIWFSNVIQHDIRCCNTSDIDVLVHQNQSAFGVVERVSGAASTFEWRPFPYELVDCSANSDCRTCLTNEANIERCRWCESSCRPFAIPCENQKPSTFNATLCMNASTTSLATNLTLTMMTITAEAATTATQSESTVLMNSTSSLSEASVSFAMTVNSDADPLIPLYAVLGVVGGLAVVGGVVALIWNLRKKGNDSDEVAKAGDVQLVDRGAGGGVDADDNLRYTPFNAGAPDGPYDVGNIRAQAEGEGAYDVGTIHVVD
jgi:hypothetical protein